MDALSDVLRLVRLEGACYLRGEFTAPWCIRGELGLASIREKLAGAEHVAFFHFLTEGRCKVRLAEGGETVEAAAGDLILFPLPRMLCIRIGDGPAAALLRELFQAGVRESAAFRPGGGSVLAKVAELLFIEALRRHMEGLPPGGTGWLAGVRDAHVGRALALLHDDPGRSWTVDELAHAVALSRSALAERFTAMVGESPMQYLTSWRLALAAHMLRSGLEPIVRIAERSGYESEAAFSRAFKREFGSPPASWRRMSNHPVVK